MVAARPCDARSARDEFATEVDCPASGQSTKRRARSNALAALLRCLAGGIRARRALAGLQAAWLALPALLVLAPGLVLLGATLLGSIASLADRLTLLALLT